MQALAALYSSASAAPGAASASAPVDGFATGSDGADVVSSTLAKVQAALGRELGWQRGCGVLGKGWGSLRLVQRCLHTAVLSPSPPPASSLTPADLRRLAQQQTATGTASGDSADVHTISACDSASGAWVER